MLEANICANCTSLRWPFLCWSRAKRMMLVAVKRRCEHTCMHMYACVHVHMMLVAVKRRCEHTCRWRRLHVYMHVCTCAYVRAGGASCARGLARADGATRAPWHARRPSTSRTLRSTWPRHIHIRACILICIRVWPTHVYTPHLAQTHTYACMYTYMYTCMAHACARST